MDQTIKQYRYFFRFERYLLAMAFFIFASLYLFYLAGNNDEGLIIQGLIRLNPSQANIFYLVVASLCMLVVFLIMISRIFIRKKQIIVYPDRIEIPKPLRGKTELIFYGDIVFVSDQDIQKLRMASIITKSKESYSIIMNCLDSIDEYNEILSILRVKVANNKYV